MLRPIADTTEAGNIAAPWVEVVHEAGAVSVADEELAARERGRIRRMVLREVGVLRAERVRPDVQQLSSVGRAYRDQLPGVVRNPVLVLAIALHDVETVGSRESMLPRPGEASCLTIGDQVVVGIVCQEHNPAVPILADTVAVPDRIFVGVQAPPQPS